MSTSGGRAPRKNVAYTKPHEPAFLKAFKTKVGYKEPASVGEFSQLVGYEIFYHSSQCMLL